MTGSMPEYPETHGCGGGLLCPLNQVKAGTSVRIKQLSAKPEVTCRLREMGFCEESEIKLVSTTCNLICLVCNSRLGISSDLGKTILVEMLPKPRKLA